MSAPVRGDQFGIIDATGESEDAELDFLRYNLSNRGPRNGIVLIAPTSTYFIYLNCLKFVETENEEKLDKLISLLESMQIQNRESNAILYEKILTLGLLLL